MKKTEEKVIRFVEKHKLIEQNNKLLIGLSGGPDSVFALYFFNKFSKRFKINLSAVHINHLIRGENSDIDEDFSKKLCDKLSVEYISENVDVKKIKKKSKKSLEEIAREERYRIYQEQAEKLGADKIVTAHNQDDNTETVLLNLIKGTGIKGLTGIPIKRSNIIRPLLCLSKKEITDYLKSNKINYRIDRTNLENYYDRNFIRNKIIPQLIENLNPSLHQAVFRMSNNLQSYSTILETTLSKTTAKVWANKKLKLAALNKFDNELTNEIIKRGLEKYYDSKINSNDIEKVKKLVNSQVGKKIKLRKNFIALRERETIIIYKEESEKFSEVKLKPGETVVVGSQKISIEKINKSEIKWNLKGIEYISIDDENPIFTIRNWKSGDKFKPLGMNSFKKVSDFLTDLKIPSLTKKTKFLLEYRNQIVWVIGLRIDNRFKITSSSKRIYKLCQQ